MVYTAIYGSYDTLKKIPKQTIKADYVCFTDDISEIKKEDDTWMMVEQKFSYYENIKHPRLQAKYFRMHPHVLFPKYDYTLWID